ncbi:hypothetical protein L0U85_01710 [Glycomyces sp. L485]|uniref:hypothetical protein n=1 Tax=Glycomyces sp. L485 TaxID=2909235 RepID=UPI001F4B62C7|nr:hypothetical protein [Glycomyces sp. L485]MCH7229584.1 hypothetical protein [Glycomyces sp. L485]
MNQPVACLREYRVADIFIVANVSITDKSTPSIESVIGRISMVSPPSPHHPITHQPSTNLSHALGRVAVLVIPVVSLVFGLVPAASAQASTSSEVEYSGGEILSRIASSASSQEFATEYLESNARSGVLTDASAVNVATLPDPTVPEGTIDVVWPSDLEPTGLFLGREDASEGGEVDAATAVGLTVQEVPSTSKPSIVESGSGFGSVQSATGAYLYSSGSATIHFTPAVEHGAKGDHIMNTLYQKYAVSGTDRWFYNRYSNFRTRTNLTTFFREFTIRSRPWNENNSNFFSVLGHAPTQYNQHCNGANAELGAGGASISFPITQCDSVTPILIGSDFHFGAKFKGNAKQSYMGIDAAMSLRAANNSVVPSFADYNWVEARECTDKYCSAKVHSQWDSGW